MRLVVLSEKRYGKTVLTSSAGTTDTVNVILDS